VALADMFTMRTAWRGRVRAIFHAQPDCETRPRHTLTTKPLWERPFTSLRFGVPSPAPRLTSAILATITLGVLSAQPPIQLAPLRDWLTH